MKSASSEADFFVFNFEIVNADSLALHRFRNFDKS